jgi:alpha-N-arabinofuranosidase
LALRLRGRRSTAANGRPGDIMLFAPTLRHHDGLFYIVCTNMADGQGNFLVTASDPAGDWSDAIWLDREAFDPSLLFDEDGTCYYTRRTLDLSSPGGDLGPVVQAQLDPRTGEMGPLRAITPGPRGFQCNDVEGPHLYRIGGWYYLFCAEGSTWLGHMQTIARSRSPWGPFEAAPHNPVITHRNRVLHPIQTLGHADLVEDANGRWWALALGTRHRDQHHNLGRETFLLPVAWRDDWPYIGKDGGTELENAWHHSPSTGGAVCAPEQSL